jgi:asparagine synthase (glutamine-hydrolysing)
MSVQFGRWNFDGKSVEQNYLEKVQPLLLPYGPDDRGSYSSGAISMLYCAFHTTKESRRETQPHLMASGAVITWDGRLDNRADMIKQLGDVVTSASTDVSIVAAAYDRWGGGCFARLIGDWALSVWDAHTRSLILAKDPIGTRHLYYSFDNNQVTWSTILDPLVLLAGKTFALCEEYIAGWFAFFPAAHLTPYVGIHAVPPSSSVVLRPGKHTVTKYWDFDPGKRIRYRRDGEYEEHFRMAFGEAVRRRLRSDRPVLAELSGGMDSSSIVCMADFVITRGEAETPRLDTVSYYDDSEPNWNERPYFTMIEERRGRTGTHIDLDSGNELALRLRNDRFAVMPGSSDQSSDAFISCMTSQENRVVLSGIGGDEMTGGVPTPTPELEDLLATGQFRKLAHTLKVWAISKRQPWFYLLAEVARGFFPVALVGVPQNRLPVPWLNKGFAERNRPALRGYQRRLTLSGSLPTFQESLATLDALRRHLHCVAPILAPLYEKRYPYLDRSLLEFLYCIPRDQLVRPGERRSLMRRALTGIVPDEIINRKRKAYMARAPLVTISRQWTDLLELTLDMSTTSLGLIDKHRFVEALSQARRGVECRIVALFRTLSVEAWLTALCDRGIVNRYQSSTLEVTNNQGSQKGCHNQPQENLAS